MLDIMQQQYLYYFTSYIRFNLYIYKRGKNSFWMYNIKERHADNFQNSFVKIP